MKNPMRFSILASGSRGNACYIEAGPAKILVDAGLSAREIEFRLGLIGASAKKLNAIVVTHEHSDHIKGVGPLARRYHLPVFLNKQTLDSGEKRLGKLPIVMPVETGNTFSIDSLSIETFTKCHDAADPMGLVLSSNGTRMGFVTDMGRITHLTENRLKACDVLVMEFNYDPDMLAEGPYPLDLKRRINGNEGHLSNEQACQLVASSAHSELKWLVLAHLSETNNHPGKALQAAEKILRHCRLNNTQILVGKQDTPSRMIEI